MFRKVIPSSFAGESGSVHDLRRQAAQLADAPFPIIITGETGTGKFELALLLHEKSQRATSPFVDIHCANLSDTLFESTMFGHERGSFTDARERQTGLIEQAGHGTLLFDEVDCLTTVQQAKLLRFIDRRHYERLGSTVTYVSRASLIFTTNQDLFARTRSAAFRNDLLHRMTGVTLHIPPLRKRREDIPFLATLFLEDCQSRSAVAHLRWSAGALRLMSSYGWPGNVRELKQLVEVTAYLHASHAPISESEVDDRLHRVAETPNEMQPSSAASLADIRTLAEREKIVDALRMTDGNRVRAARLLKIGRRTLHEKITRYGL